MPSEKKFTLVLDSSQIAAYCECPQRWFYTSVKRLEPIAFEPDEEAMNAGTYGHKLLDIYYKYKGTNIGYNDLLEHCLSYNPDTDTCECGCNKDYHKELAALGIQECSRCKKCIKFRPKHFNLLEPTRALVRNRFREYCFKYQSNDFAPLSSNHVEVGFSEPIYEDHYNLFVLEGRIDLLARLQGLACLVDHKFQMRSHWLYSKSIQFKNYALISKMTTLIINYVRLQKTATPDTFSREIVSFTAPELAAWKQKLIKIFFDVKDSLVSEQLRQNWDACRGSFPTYDKNKSRYCWYGQLCEENEETMRSIREKRLYKIKEHEWRPW